MSALPQGNKTFALALAGALMVMSVVLLVVVIAVWDEVYKKPPAAEKSLAVTRPTPTQEPDPGPRTDPEAEKREQEKRRREFTRLMIQGGTALGIQNYSEAVAAYEEALKLFPEDVEAAKGLNEARTSLTSKAKEKQTNEERQAEFGRLMAQGQEAMSKREFAVAVNAFEAALRFVAGDVAATRALAEARTALEADLTQQKKLTDYRNHLAAGRAAMVGGRYQDAVREFVAARLLLPEDGVAERAQKDAEKRLEELQEQDKQKSNVSRLLTQGGAALRNKRFEEALRAYKAALKIAPKNPDAKQGFKDAQKALDIARAEFGRLMDLGDLAYVTGRYGDAVVAYGEASRMFPDDANATARLQASQQAVANLAALAIRQAAAAAARR